MNALDRAILAISPRWGENRLRARLRANLLARHYEAAQSGRRTSGWTRSVGDANLAGASLATLRAHARDLVRNNGWALNSKRVISRNTIGWGIIPKPVSDSATGQKKAKDLWLSWATSTDCDFDGLMTFYGLQRMVMDCIAESGEALVRIYPRKLSDGLAIPMQLRVLEPDHLDMTRDGPTSSGGFIIQGVEFDVAGRRVAYWLYPTHPGAQIITMRNSLVSKRIDASEVIRAYQVFRPGQVRGVSWFAPAIVNMKDFDEYEDATLLKQKIAACFSAFVTDVDGTMSPIGGAAVAGDAASTLNVETLEPGLVTYLQPGRDVTFSNPPASNEHASFSQTNLRKIAAAMGVTYEDMTGDYSQVNFSSARMARIAHWGNVYDWRENMIIPQFCNRAWNWAMTMAVTAGLLPEVPTAQWTSPPMPMIEPDKEGLAYQRLVRNGTMTYSEMIREQGGDPETHWEEYAADQKRLDEHGIWLDSDVRRVSQAGLTQQRAGSGDSGGDSGGDTGAPAEAPAEAAAE